MALKTVNVSEETKRALDALIEVSGMTADQVVGIALQKLCPGILDETRKETSDEKLMIKAARAHIASLRYQRDKLWAREHGLTMAEMGYPEEDED
jgi:nitrogen regulatory protein PII